MIRTELRPFQADVKAALYREWAQNKVANLLAVLPTGAGKTVLFSDIISDEQGAVCVMAHRSELVSQISLALAKNGVRHRIIGSDALRRACAALHLDELGVSYVDANSRVAAASVKTLVGMDKNDPWFAAVSLVVGDEGHHYLRDNEWGKACKMFPNARALLVTATPCRADGKGLGSHADGIVDKMIVGPGMRDIINMGFLTDYRIFCPPSDLDVSDVPITASGELSQKKLAAATRRSSITGDIVEHYLRIAPGKLGITFAVDVEHAGDLAAAFRARGVPAEVVTSKTPDLLRAQILRDFKARKILQLINVDLFGEGFDLPAIEVVSMGRKTESYSLYAQQFGRVLRLLDGKERGIIIDHVGNVLRHGLPDKRREWTLDRRSIGVRNATDENVIPLTTCTGCSNPFERIYSKCPHCGVARPAPAARSAPEFVEGDLFELDPDVLATMRGEIEEFDGPPVIPYGASEIVKASINKKKWERDTAQRELRNTIAVWAGWQKRDYGRTDSEIYRLFFLTYGTDIMRAQVLPAAEATELCNKLRARLDLAQIKAA
jgi:superfamily II DNA or RNA helicase